MHTCVLGGAIQGIDVHLVQVEVDISSGLPATRTVGLPEAAAKEGNERVRAAIQNSGFPFPCKRIIINLAPADVRKKGSSLDLAVAVATVAASEGLDTGSLEGVVLYGELGLDGRIRPVPGALSASMAVRAAGLRALIVAPENAAEASAIEGTEVLPASSLAQVIAHVRGESTLASFVRERGGASALIASAPHPYVDLSEVRGQAQARRALEIAAAGGHNLLMVGPPGSGKTMLARSLPGILPPLGEDEAIEVTRIHGAIGTGVRGGLIRSRPFRSPHHTASEIALVGGGAQARPGEVSLAHHGVLFLDEFTEFRREALEALRQPLEEGFVTVSRLARSLRYPAAFMLAAAMNPCRCGHRGDSRKECRCSPRSVERYRARISGPLLDRIDLHVEVPAVSYKDLAGGPPGESSAAVAARVQKARERQAERYRDARAPDGRAVPAWERPVGSALASAGRSRSGGEEPWGSLPSANARVPARVLRAFATPDAQGRRLLESAMTRLALSARGHGRILRVARTIADLEGCEAIRAAHIAEAIQYRYLDRPVEAAGAPS